MPIQTKNGRYYLLSGNSRFYIKPGVPTAPAFSPTSVILTSDTSYTVPAGAKVIKIWSIGAGGSTTNPCDGGPGQSGTAGLAAYRHGIITNTGGSLTASIGQPITGCSLAAPAGSTTISGLSSVISPSVTSVVGGGGANGHPAWGGGTPGASSNQFGLHTLWASRNVRRDFVGINAVITAAGGNAATHTYGKEDGTGSAGAVVLQFLPATDIVIPFVSGSGTFTVPTGYSSVKIWVVGEGGIGTVYCDGGPSTLGGRGGVSHRTWSVSGGETINYSVGRVLTGGRFWCLNPANGASSTATLNGVTITGTGGQGNGTNGTGTGGDGSGIAGNDVGSINAAILSYAPSMFNYGFPGDDSGTFGGVSGAVLIQLIV
jgi:hypothetical protein